MVFDGFRKDSYFFQLDESKVPLERWQDKVQSVLEGGEENAEPKWHSFALKETMMTTKRGLVAFLFGRTDFPEASVCIKCQEAAFLSNELVHSSILK